jgi:hypothetical protein
VIRYSYGDIPYYLQLGGDLSAQLNVAMAAVVADYEDRPFGTIAEMAMHYVMGHEFNIDSGEDTLFCAQLVALTFMKLGLFKDTHPANWYSPNSFAMPQASELPWAMSTSFTLPVEIDVPPMAAMAALSETQLARWPAGPIAPAQLATAPSAPWLSTQ